MCWSESGQDRANYEEKKLVDPKLKTKISETKYSVFMLKINNKN